MTRDEKHAEVQRLTASLADFENVYLADSSELTVESITTFRRLCFEKGVQFKVVKNTLLKKAMEQSDAAYDDLYEFLNGPTSILLAEQANVPAKVLKEFRKEHDKPLLKVASIETALFVGDGAIEELAALKSKEELIGEIIGLLQSPVKNVIGGLQASGGDKIAGLVKALQERESN